MRLPLLFGLALIWAGCEVDTPQVGYFWQVTKDGDPVDLPDAARKVLDWIPTEPGNYTAHLHIEYGGKTVRRRGPDDSGLRQGLPGSPEKKA